MIGEPAPLVFDASDEIYTKNDINFTSLKYLDSIGLISFESTSGCKKYGFGKQAVIFCFGQPALIEFSKEKDNEIKVGKTLFTQAGKNW